MSVENITEPLNTIHVLQYKPPYKCSGCAKAFNYQWCLNQQENVAEILTCAQTYSTLENSYWEERVKNVKNLGKPFILVQASINIR